MVGERRLVALAYRLLGTVTDAEDAVQETYIRWYRLSEEERTEIANVQGWLTRVAGHVCLDVLKSARVRREQYVGPWPPCGSSPPRPGGGYMPRASRPPPPPSTPPWCAPSPRPVPAATWTPWWRFSTRASSCAPTVELRSDGGGLVKAVPNPIFGAAKVARFLFGVLDRVPEWRVRPCATADGLGVTFERDGRVEGVVNLRVADGRVGDVWIVLNPEKLTRWA